jgi:calcineurin-like phosphoesterase family protein
MANVFLIGDTHFGHQKMYEFTNYDGSKVRPWATCEEGDEIMVERWNAIVKPFDKVYHLGDVAISKRALPILDRLNGKKVLIRGNHDIFKLVDYMPYFYDIRGSHKLSDYILSHVPIHPDALTNRWCRGNIHGHLHNNLIKVEDVNGGMCVDMRYINVSVERINYTPIALEAIESLRDGQR